MLADNQSARAMAHVGTLGDRVNDFTDALQSIRNENVMLRRLVEALADELAKMVDEVDGIKAAAGLA